MKNKYTKTQIESAIRHWANVLLESASSTFVKNLIGESQYQLLMEGKLDDAAVKLIAKSKWTKKDALKADNLKLIKRIYKQGDDFTKERVNKLFAERPELKASSKKSTAKTTAAKPRRKAPTKGAPSEKTSTLRDDEAAKEVFGKVEAVESSIGEFDIFARLYRVHLGAAQHVKEVLGQFLQKQKAGSPNSVIVRNSCIADRTFKMPSDGKMHVEVAVKLDATQLTAFGKMVALMKEDELDEDAKFIKDIWAGIKQGAKSLGKAASDTFDKMGNTAKEKLQTAHERLKKNIGIAAIKEYVQRFCGKALADNVSLKNIAMNQDDESVEGAELVFSCVVDVK